MDVKVAAARTLALYEKRADTVTLTKIPGVYASILHLREMNAKIQSGEVSGEKAHRWLGWMQACVYCTCSAVSLGDFKDINKAS